MPVVPLHENPKAVLNHENPKAYLPNSLVQDIGFYRDSKSATTVPREVQATAGEKAGGPITY